MSALKSNFDVCKCGDYRHHHVDGRGRCRMPDDLTHGMKPCRRFALHAAYRSPAWERIHESAPTKRPKESS